MAHKSGELRAQVCAHLPLVAVAVVVLCIIIYVAVPPTDNNAPTAVFTQPAITDASLVQLNETSSLPLNTRPLASLAGEELKYPVKTGATSSQPTSKPAVKACSFTPANKDSSTPTNRCMFPAGCQPGINCTYEVVWYTDGTDATFLLTLQVTPGMFTLLGWNSGLKDAPTDYIGIGYRPEGIIVWEEMILADGSHDIKGLLNDNTTAISNANRTSENGTIALQVRRSLAPRFNDTLPLNECYYYIFGGVGVYADRGPIYPPRQLPQLWPEQFCLPPGALKTPTGSSCIIPALGMNCGAQFWRTPAGCVSGQNCNYEMSSWVSGMNVVFNLTKANMTPGEYTSVGWSKSPIPLNTAIADYMLLEVGSNGAVSLKEAIWNGTLNIVGSFNLTCNVRYFGGMVSAVFIRPMKPVFPGTLDLQQSLYYAIGMSGSSVNGQYRSVLTNPSMTNDTIQLAPC